MDKTKSCKVLVVEDEGLIAHDIATRLEALGHQVVGAVGTANEALDLAGEADIVLMDIRIDGAKDGVEAAAEIRERYHLPVIFLTAHADRATLERAKLTGPFGYIVKPLAHASLHTTIEIALYQHRIERLLAEREAWLSTALNSVAGAVVVTDLHGRVRLLNHTAEALTGWVQSEAEHQPVEKVVRLIDGVSGKEGDDPVPLALLRDAPVAFDRACQLAGRNGRQVSIEGAAAPVKAAGVLLGAVLTFRDASARRWEERHLGQSQKMEALGRLAASVSNDYSYPLAIIRSQTVQLQRQFGEYSPARRPVEEIHQAATTAEQITRRLASFGTLQVSQPEVLSLNGVLRRMSRLIESVAGPGVDLAIRTAPAAGRVKADAGQVEQAIMSLALHACAVMSQDPRGTGRGQLLIETSNVEAPAAGVMSKYVLVAISHSGREPDVDKLFEPTSAGDDSLALSIVHGIVTEHGGYVSAQGAPEGGCRFEILLPRWSPPAPLSQPGLAPSVMLVDHRERVRLQLHNYFEAHGYNLLEAADAGEAAALGEVHEGVLGLLIAEEPHAAAIAAELRPAHPDLGVLRIVDRPESSPNEIRKPFTQAVLLSRVAELIGARAKADFDFGGLVEEERGTLWRYRLSTRENI